jgi:hypothetical protein
MQLWNLVSGSAWPGAQARRRRDDGSGWVPTEGAHSSPSKAQRGGNPVSSPPLRCPPQDGHNDHQTDGALLCDPSRSGCHWPQRMLCLDQPMQLQASKCTVVHPPRVCWRRSQRRWLGCSRARLHAIHQVLYCTRRGARHDSPDLSPPRRGRHGSEDEPPMARRDSPDDLSPPRRARHDSEDDLSPPRRKRHDSPDDFSPPRRARHDSEDDLSPPRRGRHDSGHDLSPPRRPRHDSPDLSPPRRGRHCSADLSPPRKQQRLDSGPSASDKLGQPRVSGAADAARCAVKWQLVLVSSAPHSKNDWPSSGPLCCLACPAALW